MRKIALLPIALVLSAVLAAAQSTSSTASVTQQAAGPANIAGLLYASNFAHWTVSPSSQGLRWSSPNQCFGTSGGLVFPVFSTTAPITIVDLDNSAHTETVTPTIATYSGSGCSVGLPATYAHANYYLQSGTLGLQEALNFAGSGNFVVILTPDWKTMGGTTSMITSAAAGSGTTVLDMRTSTPISYTGSTPSSNVTGTGKQVLQTSPTLVTPTIGAATGTTLVLTAVAPTVTSGQVGFGATTVVVSNCGTTGPTACLVVNIAGTVHYIPYY